MEAKTGKIVDLDSYESAIARLRDRMGAFRYPTIDYTEFLGRTNEVATKDAIRHFCNSIGDINPLYREPSYATNTKFGEIIAPPFFLNSIYPAQGQYEAHLRSKKEPPLPFFMPVTGHSWQWFQSIRLNDKIAVSLVSPLELNDLSEGQKTRYVQQVDRITYSNKDGVVAICDVEAMYTEDLGSAKNQPPNYSYTDKEIEEIRRAYKAEKVRGAMPRYWEDVNEGDELEPMVKGPLTYTDMIAFYVGVGWNDQGFGCKEALLESLPEAGYWTDNGSGERICTIHVINEAAQTMIGLPKAFDFGLQRGCWIGHFLSNWMGDDGFLKKFNVKWIGFNFIGDTLWIKGKVTKKYIENNENLVDLEIRTENQRGAFLSNKATATIVLPTKPEV